MDKVGAFFFQCKKIVLSAHSFQYLWIAFKFELDIHTSYSAGIRLLQNFVFGSLRQYHFALQTTNSELSIPFEGPREKSFVIVSVAKGRALVGKLTS